MSGVVALNHHLRVPVAVADVDETQRPEIADLVHPAKEHDVFADFRGAEGTRRMRADQVTELFCHIRYQVSGTRDQGPGIGNTRSADL